MNVTSAKHTKIVLLRKEPPNETGDNSEKMF